MPTLASQKLLHCPKRCMPLDASAEIDQVIKCGDIIYLVFIDFYGLWLVVRRVTKQGL